MFFLSNATVGGKTAADGAFTLRNVKPGKYNLVISVVGFENYQQSIVVDNNDIALPDIELKAKIITLSEVTIRSKKDPNRQRYLEWFTDEFLGTSDIARECKIINPEVLDLDYNDTTQTLTASSYDFLIIENRALGYRIKYLLTKFTNDRKSSAVYFEGSALFEELNGDATQKNRWEKRRMEVYEGSQMHFLRALSHNQLDESGFRVLQYANYENPQRPSDSLINLRIAQYKKLKGGNSSYGDSLSYWVKESKLPKTLKKLMEYPLTRDEIVKQTDQKGIYALGCENDALHITYSADHHFPKHGQLFNLDRRDNTETTILGFNKPLVFFDNNGAVVNIGSFSLTGAWVWNRVAELLPFDYEPALNKMANGYTTQAIPSVTAKLKNFVSEHIAENVYLQFDKPYYATGDTMYFKAYVTMGERHNLSSISGVLHAELIGIDNKINQSIKLQLVDGVGWGDFALPDSLQQGTYRVRAYTRWMRNSGDDSYFEKSIPIGSLHQNKIPESNTARVKPVMAKNDLQFFPESGELVTGIDNKIAFKAIGTNGMGMDIKGEIIDNTGKEITGFASTHLGMGYFNLKPEDGKSYKANITYANGTKDVLPLPISNNKGISLIINNDSVASAAVKIEANQNYYNENKGKEYSVLIYSGGVATTVKCKLDSPTIAMDIIKRKLFTGITTITLFSQNNEPLAERLIFIQNYDQLNLDVSTDKDTYATREKVSLKLNAKTRADVAATGHFSVAITDESKVLADENNETTILTNLLLTSDLKGTIEQPNYYFTNNDDLNNNEKRKQLDLVMLTHGYRHFTWKQVLNGDSTGSTIAYQPETSLEVSGTAKNLLGTPLKKAVVSLILMAGKGYTSQTTDDKGKFNFSGLNFNDSVKFVLQAVNAKGKNRTQLTYEPDITPLIKKVPAINQTNVNPTMATYLENDAKEQDELFKQGMVKVRTLKEVKIKAFKEDNNYPSSVLGGPGHADQVMHREQIDQVGGPLVNSLNGRLIGVKFISTMGHDTPYLVSPASIGPMLVVVDGVEGGSISGLDASQIETVEVLKFASASIYGMQGGNGVLVVTTRQGGGSTGVSSIGILPITVQGYYRAREFYSPKYTAAIPQGNHPDWRSTIYWAPEVVTDKDGNASLEFYNADGQGSYRVVVEGMDEKGNIGRQVYRYKVQ